MKFRKITCIGTISLMAFGLMTRVCAEESSAYKPINGTYAVFDSTLYLEDNVAVPALTFTYKVEPWTKADINGIYCGNDARRVSGTPVICAEDETTGTKDTAALHFTSLPEAGKKTVTLKDGSSVQAVSKKMKVDFTGVTYRQPGIYRYLISESQNNTGTVRVGEDDGIQAMDVYVTADDSTLSIAGAFMHPDQEDGPKAVSENTETDSKTQEFINRYESSNLSLTKRIEGNQASKDEYFQFDIRISGGKDGEQLNLSVPVISDGSKTNPAILNFEGTSAEETIWLKADQTAVIYGLHEGMGYTVSENKAVLDGEGYSASAAVTGDQQSSTDKVTLNADTYALHDDALSEDTCITFTNRKNGIVPTGIMMSTFPAGCVCLLSGAGLIAMMLRKKKSEEK